MRASLYFVGFAAVAIVGAGMTGVGCSSSSSGTTPGDDASMGTDGSGSSSGAGSSSGGEDTGTGEAAGPCSAIDSGPLVGSVATVQTGSAVWDCYQAMCTTSLTACAADCACNNGVIQALLCVAADAGTGTTCFGMVTGVQMMPNMDLTTCLVQNAACMNATAGGGEGGTDGSTTTEAGPVDAGGGG
jgi:hypothetical protein